MPEPVPESIRATAIETALAAVEDETFWSRDRAKYVKSPEYVLAQAVIELREQVAAFPAVVAQVQADAWDEGYAKAGHELFDGVYDGDPETSANPYREKGENSHE